MRRALLWLNAFGTAITLLSSLAVLVSWLLDPGYRVHYGDALLFVVGYAAFQAWSLRCFARDAPAAPWLSVAKAIAGWLFILLFVSIGPLWMRITPARYVYQLFDWGPEARIGLFAFVFLGRGFFNTLSAFSLTRDWWFPLRDRRPLLGRLVTAIPVAAMVTLVWAFFQMVRIDAKTFSAEAYDVARVVLSGIDCPMLREREGQTTTDLRQRGERSYHVTIRWRCTDLQVEVRAEDGRIGVIRGPRLECCAGRPGPSGLPS